MSALALADPGTQARALRRQEAGERRLMLVLIVPALAIVGVLLLLPVAVLGWESIYDGGFTLKHYARMAEDAAYLETFRLTFEISLLVTALCILLGYPLAYLLNILPRHWAAFALALVVLPFWTSVLVRTYAWLVLLQRRGLVNQALIGMGITAEPVALVHNLLGTFIGMVHVMLPFMVLPLYAAMRKIPPELMQASASLGGSPAFAFRKVFLPLSMPGLIAGSILVFTISLGFYLTPALMGGGRTILISLLVQRNVEMYMRWGAASAVAMVLLLVVFILFWIVDRAVSVERLFGAR